MDEQLIDTPVGRLRVRVIGSGPPALLWHSLFVDSRSWDRLVPRLADHRRLVLVDGPGHGASGDPGRLYTLDECADAAVAVLERLGIGDAVDWVGNAYGGHVGIVVAAREPGRCRTLAALGAPVAALTAQERLRTYLLLAVYRLAGPVRAVIDGVVGTVLSADSRAHDPEAVALVRDGLLRADRARLRRAVVSVSLRRPDLSALLPRVAVPVFVATGAEHAGFTAAQARAAAAALPLGSSAVVPGAAYLLPLEAPEACAELLLKFWAVGAPHDVPDRGRS